MGDNPGFQGFHIRDGATATPRLILGTVGNEDKRRRHQQNVREVSFMILPFILLSMSSYYVP